MVGIGPVRRHYRVIGRNVRGNRDGPGWCPDGEIFVEVDLAEVLPPCSRVPGTQLLAEGQVGSLFSGLAQSVVVRLIFFGVDLQDATGLDDPCDQAFCLLLNRLTADRAARLGGCRFPVDCCRAARDSRRLRWWGNCSRQPLARGPHIVRVGAVPQIMIAGLGGCGAPDTAFPADCHEAPALERDRRRLEGGVLHDALGAAVSDPLQDFQLPGIDRCRQVHSEGFDHNPRGAAGASLDFPSALTPYPSTTTLHALIRMTSG